MFYNSRVTEPTRLYTEDDVHDIVSDIWTALEEEFGPARDSSMWEFKEQTIAPAVGWPFDSDDRYEDRLKKDNANARAANAVARKRSERGALEREQAWLEERRRAQQYAKERAERDARIAKEDAARFAKKPMSVAEFLLRMKEQERRIEAITAAFKK